MPTWGEILQELQDGIARTGAPDFDGIRRKYIAQLHELTGRDTIVYATDWMNTGGPITSIVISDMQGLMEVCKGLAGPNLDIVLHSPGGSAEATASIVRYLRQKFTHIRVFVPLAAMSAATMWALAADEIVMGKHSQLGPIDPQLVSTQGQFPARAIIEQFERAKRECASDPSLLGAWVPILQQYGPSLLEQCEKAEDLAKRLVTEWLEAYMFKDRENARELAEATAGWFANYEIHQSHSLGISREAAEGQQVNVTNLEDDQDLQDAVLSVHHATIHTLSMGPSVKIIENHLEKAFVLSQQTMQVPLQIPMQGPPNQQIAQPSI